MKSDVIWCAGTRWARATFLVSEEIGELPCHEREGWVGIDLPLWALHRNKEGIILTHLPTGCAAGQAKSLDIASEGAQRLEALPFQWAADTVDVIGCKSNDHLSPEEREFYLETQALFTTPTPTEEKKPGPQALRTPRTREAPNP